jgi:hypothetical protein
MRITVVGAEFWRIASIDAAPLSRIRERGRG